MPLNLAEQGLDRILLEAPAPARRPKRRWTPGSDLVERIQNPKDEITLHFVGKYVEYEDSYKSINEALFHGGFRHRLKVKLKYIEAEALEAAGRPAACSRTPSASWWRRASAIAAAAA